MDLANPAVRPLDRMNNEEFRERVKGKLRFSKDQDTAPRPAPRPMPELDKRWRPSEWHL